MRVMSVRPGRPETAMVEERPEPVAGPADVLVEGLLVGICGTDREVVTGGYGRPPVPGGPIVLGHESLGRVLDAPPGSGLTAGDLVVGVVRRPDPVPCPACAADAWDMCRNGRYTSRGITGLDGYGAQRWVAAPRFLVRVDRSLGARGVLVEPASVLAKAWEQIELLRTRTPVAPPPAGATALIVGAGPLGLLAALRAAQLGYHTHVVARPRTAAAGPGRPDPADGRAKLIAELGATWHDLSAGFPSDGWDVVVETTGVADLVPELLAAVRPGAVVCLAGLAEPPAARLPLRRLVTANVVLFGTVSAAHRHYAQAARWLGDADPGWLDRLLTRRVPVDTWPAALAREPGDLKAVVELTVGALP